jgi:hypothetical protein
VRSAYLLSRNPPLSLYTHIPSVSASTKTIASHKPSTSYHNNPSNNEPVKRKLSRGMARTACLDANQLQLDRLNGSIALFDYHLAANGPRDAAQRRVQLAGDLEPRHLRARLRVQKGQRSAV